MTEVHHPVVEFEHDDFDFATIEEEVQQIDYYQQRISDFLAIHGDGYVAWEEECPLRDKCI